MIRDMERTELGFLLLTFTNHIPDLGWMETTRDADDGRLGLRSGISKLDSEVEDARTESAVFNPSLSLLNSLKGCIGLWSQSQKRALASGAGGSYP